MAKITLNRLRQLVDIQHWFGELGKGSVVFLEESGGLWLLLCRTVRAALTRRFRWKSTLEQAFRIGVASLPLVMLTSLFTGIVLALQSAYQLKLLSAERFIADLVALSLTRELGPVLTAMMVTGRVGASIAAEIGTMKVTEQIDALKSLASDPVHYLVVPRFVATISMLVILTIYGDVIGVFGGYLVSVFKLGLSSYQYFHRTITALVLKDVFTGLIKAFIFGVIISIVGCYYGFKAKGGAEGVGHATTMAVVVSFISIIVADTFFTALFYFVF